MPNAHNGPATGLKTKLVPIANLRPHPRNYKHHPPEQLRHILASVNEHGFYRPVVAARDLTILAGHGLAEAAKMGGYEAVPVHVMQIEPDSPQALRVLASDNETPRLGETDASGLEELLREVAAAGGDLLGTGFDEAALDELTASLARDVEADGAAESGGGAPPPAGGQAGAGAPPAPWPGGPRRPEAPQELDEGEIRSEVAGKRLLVVVECTDPAQAVQVADACRARGWSFKEEYR